MNKPEFLTRTITGLIIGAISVSAIIYSPWTYLAWLVLIVYLGTREYFLLEKASLISGLGGSVPFILALVVGGTGYSLIQKFSAIPALVLLPALLGIRLLVQLFFTKDVTELVKVNKATLSAASYLGLPALSGCIFFIEDYSWQYVLIPVLLIWINDIGAYLIGSQWGKHKIAPVISPGKSIEGTVGGGFTTILAGYVFCLFWPDISAPYIMTLGFATPVFALAGDLWESALKRDAGVKDSGRLLPGHGGILDRYDSLLFVMPVAALAYFIFVL